MIHERVHGEVSHGFFLLWSAIITGKKITDKSFPYFKVTTCNTCGIAAK